MGLWVRRRWRGGQLRYGTHKDEEREDAAEVRQLPQRHSLQQLVLCRVLWVLWAHKVSDG